MENLNETTTTNRKHEINLENVVENPMLKTKNDVSEASSNPRAENACGDVNMEATIIADDVARAGGFGARDDIGKFLPVAADSTDFEASLLDAQEFEEPQGEKRRPGLGWIEPMEKE